jgi:hypothetical protein
MLLITWVGEIERVRCEILSAWVACCTVALNDAVKATLPPCNRAVCAATKVGAIVIGLQVAGLYPSPASTDVMHRSVLAYWKDIKNIGSQYAPYRPCTSTSSGRYATHSSPCSFEQCFGDFGIIKDAKATLERHAHNDIWTQWQAKNLL